MRTAVNKELFGRRFVSYIDRLYRYALSLTHHRERACDLVQSCAVKALSATRVPGDEPAYRSWLFKILRNTYRDEVRAERRQPVSLDSELTGDEAVVAGLAADPQDADHDVLLDELRVRDALERLSREQCRILILIDVLGYSYREAAAHLGVPLGTVMSRISRARAALLAQLDAAEGPERRPEARGAP